MAQQLGYGLYLHIPYCRQRCPYCHFHVIVQAKPPVEAFLQAMEHECQARAPLFAGQPTSLYVGGGTPSLLGVKPLLALRQMALQLGLAPTAEATIEVEPGTLTLAELVALRAGGYNRISVGVQSGSAQLLAKLGRGHTVAMATDLVAQVRQAGFTNLNVDLMFAIPGQSKSQLAADIEHALACQPEHLSLYALTYHEGTAYYRWRAQGKLRPVEEGQEAAMMEQIHHALSLAGYEHYEVSNYALPKARSQHNQGYWHYQPYLGLGPGAHSFWKDEQGNAYRWQGKLGPNTYCRQFAQPQPPLPWHLLANEVAMLEACAGKSQLLECMMGAMRTKDGIDLCHPLLAPQLAVLAPIVHHYRAQGLLWWRGTKVGPTEQGMMLADTLALAFANLNVAYH